MATIEGTAGNDSLPSSPQDDTISGGAGTDVASFAGVSAGYKVTRNASGAWVVDDLDSVNGDTGTDTLTGIETLRFTDQDWQIRPAYASVGSEFKVNTTTNGSQEMPTVAALSDGGFVVTWMSYNQDGSGWGIYGQRYGADGTASDSEFKVNTTTANEQQSPTVAALSGGGFVVTWMSHAQDGSSWGIYGQRYGADGTVSGGEFRVNTTTGDQQQSPAVAALSDGGFVVSWMSHNQDSSGWGIYGQRFASNGTASGSEFRVNTSTSDQQQSPTIAALSGGGFVVSWMSYNQDGSGWGIYGQRYAANGTASGGEFRANTTTANEQQSPAVAALSDGGFLVTWMSNIQDGSGWGIYGQRYAADGSASGSEFKVNTTNSNSQQAPAVAALGDGGFLVTWMSEGQDGSGWGIYGQRFDSDGTFRGAEFRVNTTTTHSQHEPAVTALKQGGLLVSWISDNQDGSDRGIYSQRYDALANALLIAGAGDDKLYPGPGNEVLDGGAGYNVVEYQGSEYDYIVTRNGDGSVTVRAITGTPFEADGTDTLFNTQLIKFLDGSTERILDDVANVQASTNVQVAFGAETSGQIFRGDQDWYRASGGNANQAVHITFAGSDGSLLRANTAAFGNSTWPDQIAATTLDANGALSLNVSNTGLALNSVNSYRFTVLRDLIGTSSGETLTAGTTAEYLEGGGGNDSLVGSARSDYLSGGTGDDTLVGGTGNDTLMGGDGTNDRDIAVFTGRFSEYEVRMERHFSHHGWETTASPTNIWWTVTNAQGETSYIKGVELLRFADKDYLIDDYDTLQGVDIQSQATYAGMGEVIKGQINLENEDDWIAFDFGRGVVDKNTTLKLTLSGQSPNNFRSDKSISFVNATGFTLQFKDLADGTTKTSLGFAGSTFSSEYLIQGMQWGANAEGGAFGGGQTFLVVDGRGTNHSTLIYDPNWYGYNYPVNGLPDIADQFGAYSISISRYRAGTAENDVLSTDGATEQTRADEVAGLGGNDLITGTARDEVLDGGEGNDTINAGAGHDRLKGGAGTDALYGEAGNDTFIISGEATGDDVFDGGEGTDTLSIGNDVNLTAAQFNSVELMEGSGRVTVSAAQLAGFTSAKNVIFSGSNQDLSSLGGNHVLEGTIGDDVLKAGAGDNTIRPLAGNNTVFGGEGNDTVIWERGWGTYWDMQYRADHVLSFAVVGSNYQIRGAYDGGSGVDTLEFRLNDNLHHQNTIFSGWTSDNLGRTYQVDLTGAQINNFETLKLTTASFTAGGATYSWGPSAIFLTAPQYSSLSSLSGGNYVIQGGGTVNLNAVALSNGASVSLSGDQAYTLIGTASGEALSTFGGNDSISAGDGKDIISGGGGVDTIDAGAGDDTIIISNKSTVADVITGGAGVDTLRITGTDVDLSNATLNGVEKLEVNSASLALTQAQYEQFKDNLTGSAGLILKMTTPGRAEVGTLPAGFVGIRGTADDDVLVGGAGADLLVGDAGHDSLSGGAGNDRLVAGAGNDTLRGGEGDDTLTDLPGSLGGLVDGGPGFDTFMADSTDPTIAGLSFVNVERITSASGRIKAALDQDYTGIALHQITQLELSQAGRFQYSSLPSAWTGTVIASTGNDTLVGRAGNDTIDGGAGYNVVEYQGSEYDYIVTRNGDGSVTVRAITGTPYEADGTDTLFNTQLIKFLDGATERILDDVANVQASTNAQVAFGAETSGQIFRGDQDWYRAGGGNANQAVHITFAGSDGSLLRANTAAFGNSTWPDQIAATTLDANGALSLNVSNTALALNSVNSYRFTVLRDLIGTSSGETLTAGTTAEYLEGGGGNDSLVGSARSDYLSGGTGDDTLVGGTGNDTLMGGDGANDRDIAVFTGRFSEYKVRMSEHYVDWGGGSPTDRWWTVTNAQGETSYIKGVELLRFADKDYVIDDYDTLQGVDIQSQATYAGMGEVIKGQINLQNEDDWIAFDFGRGVVDKNTTLKLTLSGQSPNNFRSDKSISFVNATGFALQFKDLADGATKTSIGFSGSTFSSEYLIQGMQWGANAEGGAFGGGQTFLVVDGGWTNHSTLTYDPNWYGYNHAANGLPDIADQFGAYSISISRYRAGTVENDVLSTDGATEQTRADEVAGLGGHDLITGTARDEVLDGGEGNDTINAGAGHDRLRGGAGTDALYGEAGNDTFIISGEATSDDVFDGGEGTDTLSIGNDVNLTAAKFNAIELMEGSGRVTVSAAQLAGFTSAKNVIFSGSNQDLSSLGGNHVLEGTIGDDVLKAGAGDNTIRPLAGNNTVTGGEGNDTVIWERGWGSDWNIQNRADQVLSSVISANNFLIQGSFDGGSGSDTLEFKIAYANEPGFYGLLGQWAYWDSNPSLQYGIDLSGATISNFEAIKLTSNSFVRNGVSYSAGPSAIFLTATQYSSLSSLSGGNYVIQGGGTVNLNAVALSNGASVSLSGDQAYTLIGTASGEALSTFGGNDSISAGDGKDIISGGGGIDTIDAGAGDDTIIISNKSTVADVITGGAGVDTLRITGTDVDLSNATLNGVEKLEANSASLALTQAQYEQFKDNLSGSAGLILKMTTPGRAEVGTLPTGFVGIRGTADDDVLIGGAGADLLVGDSGNDSLSGGAGNDRLVAGAGNDTLRGGDGNDQFSIDGVRAPTAVIDGGAGVDRLIVSDGLNLTGVTLLSVEQLSGTGTVTLNAQQLAGLSQVTGAHVQLADTKNSFAMGEVSISPSISVYLKDADANLMGERGLLGTAQDDSLTGGSANDRLLGGRGSDSMHGGLGNDTLVGGSGFDTLLGGGGNDVFMVESKELRAHETLTSDHMDGGEGSDTLTLDFSGGSWQNYRFVDGAVTNIEIIDVVNASTSSIFLSADQFRTFSTLNASSGGGLRLFIEGDGQDIDLGSIATTGALSGVRISAKIGHVDASSLNLGNGTAEWGQLEYGSLHLNQFDSVKLGSGNDTLRILGDSQFQVDAGAGNDWIRLEGWAEKLQATVTGGAGTDTLDISTLGFVDLTGLSLVGVESIRQAGTTVVVTAAQLEAWSFDGSGTKYTKSGNTIVGTASADGYSGNGTEFFQGGRGNDSIDNVNTVVFSGNYADYDFSASKDPLTIEQARGSMTDGRDTLRGVMNLKFADITVSIDDAPNENYRQQFISNATAWDSLKHAAYQQRVSGKKDYEGDTDLYSATFAPNSPLAVEGSTFTGANWRMAFWDVETGGQIQFESLVNGRRYDQWYSGMDAAAKFLPMLNGKAYEGGELVSRFHTDGAVQDYAFTLKFLDDYAGSVDTLGQMNPDVGTVRGYIGDIGDTDWIRTQLIAGTKYEFKLMGLASGGGSLLDPKLQLLDSVGRLLESGVDYAVNNVGGDDSIVFRPSTTGNYYLVAADVGKVATGSWTLSQQSLDTVAGNTSTTERISWSGANTFTLSSEINALSDRDWFKIWLDKGITYNFQALGTSQGGTLADPQLSIRSVTGILLGQDDNFGGGADAKLIYSAPDSGWYYLDAGASGNASKGVYILKGSTLADDFSNDRLTTGVVQVGTPLQGLVTYNGDSDWIKVGLSKGKVYVIDLAGDASDGSPLDPLVDPLLILRGSDGEIIARYDDFGGSLNSRAYFTPNADGLYYLEAKSAFKYDIGAYQLSVTLAPPDDFGAAFNTTASSLALGVATAGTIGIPGDRDVFKITLDAGKVYQVSVDGLANHAGTLADPYLRLFDSQGRLLDHDNNGGLGNDAQLYLETQTSGTYYIEASSSKDRGMGSYEVAVVQRALPPDEAPGNVGTTVFLKAGQSFSGHLLTHQDQDWFGIRLEAGEDYVFKLQASHSGKGTLLDPVLELRAADGGLLKAVDNMLISNEPAFVYTPTAAGTYYLAVKAANGSTDVGSYTLVTRAPDDYANTKPGAKVIALNQLVSGAIQYADGAYGVRAFDSIGLANDSDEDWFQFTAAAGQVLSVNVEIDVGSTLSRPMVEVVDANNRSVAMGDGLETLNGRAVATFKANAAGTYHARVIDGAGATGAYTLTLSAGDASDEDTQAPVAMVFLTQGGIGQAVSTAKIGLSGDTDRFTASLEAGHSYRIETLPVRDGISAPLASAKLDLGWLAQGRTTAQAIEVNGEMASPSFYDATAFTATTAGTMTIGVAPLDPTQTGMYKLRLIDLGIAQADDHPDSVTDYQDAEHGVLSSNDNAAGRIDTAGDVDLFAINLTASNIYDFSIKSYADGLGTLAQADLRLLTQDGALVTSGTLDALNGRTQLAVSVFESGRYYLAVSGTDLPGNTGTFALDARLRGEDLRIDDIRADAQSGVSAGPGRTASGRIDYAGDQDWIRVSLSAGKVYLLDVLGNGHGAGGTLADATLRLVDARGHAVAQDDDSGAALDARLQFTAQVDGDYFVDVGSNGTATGSYTVRVRELYSGVADPLQSAQWYLSALGLDALNGRITGAGVTVGMVDDGIDTAHPDLQKQIDFALSYDTVSNTADGKNKIPYPTSPAGDFHGTAVAGLIVAEKNNETGIVGVASDAEIASVRVKWTWDQITEALGRQWQFDISNNSWGAIDPFADNFNSTSLTFAYQALRTGVEDGRDGLGTVFVFSAGNSQAYGDNTNYHNFQNAREVITVAATNADGSAASFSTPGASVLVGAYGVDLLTTDRHEKGLGLATSSNYTSFTGTSAAAPIVSGVVALMLEANPALGYRDVQEILAYSASHPDNQDWKANGAANFNLGGLRFNDQTGFGVVDAYRAVRLAETWSDKSTASNEVSASARQFGLVDAIPDGDGTTYSRSFDIAADLLVEHVELGIDLRHTRLGDLVIELISPAGTVSTLMNRPTVNAEQPFGLSGTDSGVPTHLLWDFSSVQFWGEDASGTWTVNVRDVRAEETGTLKSLSLRVYGERNDGDDTYVFTNEGFTVGGNRVLSDGSGVDTVNASPVSHDMYVHLGSESLIAANSVTYKIDSWSVIENAITGSGDDRLDGNSANNRLNGMEGDDVLTGQGGDDILIGGAGHDVARYAGNRVDFNLSWDPDTKTLTVKDQRLNAGNEGTDRLTGIERLVFADAEVNLSSTVGNRAPVANSLWFDQTVKVNAGAGLAFDIPVSAFSDPDQGIGDASTLTLSVTDESGNAPPDWLSYDQIAGTLTGAPPQNYQGQLKLLITAADEFGQSASDVLTLQFGDNQAPVLQAARDWTIQEDAGRQPLGITLPTDPEGTAVRVTIDEVPARGKVLDKQGTVVVAGRTMDADDLTELSFQSDPDDFGAMGTLRYSAVDEDAVQASSSVRIVVNPINDAPRFSRADATLSVTFPLATAAPLDLATPSDPESTLTGVTVSALPALGRVWLGGTQVQVGQRLSLSELQQMSFTLTENVRGPIGALTVTATDEQGLQSSWSLNLQVTGDAVANSGTLGADSLYGSIGADTLQGMAGDDMLVGNAGNDRLLGGLGNDSLYGGSGNDTMDGSSGNDVLDGGSGDDIMSGGPGSDTYLVDSASDLVIEAIAGGAGGKDLIITTISLTAPANVEHLQAADGASLDLTGNALDNALVGNASDNVLSGGDGRDTLYGHAGNDTLNGGSNVDKMAGGAGDDTYHVDSRLDAIQELSNEGVDTVWASSHFTLPSNVEHLFLKDGGDWSGSGNSLNNRIVGNNGNNVLAGGLGQDTLEGGAGDDTYVLNDRGDVIIDTGGSDTIRTSLDTTLPDGIENLLLVGISDAAGVGNSAANQIVGNVGDNILEGGGGVDTLTGGAGSDQFVLARNATGLAADQVTDFVSGQDLLVVDLLSFWSQINASSFPSSGTIQAGSFVKGAGARALDNNDHFLLDTAQGMLRFDPDGNGPQAAIDLVKLVGTVDPAFNGGDIYGAI